MAQHAAIGAAPDGGHRPPPSVLWELGGRLHAAMSLAGLLWLAATSSALITSLFSAGVHCAPSGGVGRPACWESDGWKWSLLDVQPLYAAGAPARLRGMSLLRPHQPLSGPIVATGAAQYGHPSSSAPAHFLPPFLTHPPVDCSRCDGRSCSPLPG